MKFGRFLKGTAHTVSSAVCETVVTPRPAHSAVSTPITSANAEPEIDFSGNELPIAGNWLCTACSTDSRVLGSPAST